MTKEQAIEELKEINFNSIHEKTIMATNIAIKALEQQHCDDAISRKEAIRVSSGYCHWANIPDELAKLPSVNPKPCEDAISRKKLKELGAECIAKRDENGELIAMGCIDNLPSVNQKPCEDAISRQATLEPYKVLNDTDTLCVALIRANIMQQPLVTPQPKVDRWIPVSERLPEKNVEVLATTEWGAVTISEMYSANDWFIYEGTTNAETDEIVAWMPLPQPYKGESEDK